MLVTLIVKSLVKRKNNEVWEIVIVLVPQCIQQVLISYNANVFRDSCSEHDQFAVLLICVKNVIIKQKKDKRNTFKIWIEIEQRRYPYFVSLFVLHMYYMRI